MKREDAKLEMFSEEERKTEYSVLVEYIDSVVNKIYDDHEADLELKDIALEAQLKQIIILKKKFNIQSDRLRLFTNMYFDLLEDVPDEPRTCYECKHYINHGFGWLNCQKIGRIMTEINSCSNWKAK